MVKVVKAAAERGRESQLANIEQKKKAPTKYPKRVETTMKFKHVLQQSLVLSQFPLVV